MLRVVLADDERKVIFLLRELIDWDKLGYEIVGVAHDGLRALELVDGLTEEEFRETQLAPAAQANLAQEIILTAIAEKEGITMTDQELDKLLASYAEEYGVTVEELTAGMDRESIRSSELQQAVMNWLYENVTIEEVEETEPAELSGFETEAETEISAAQTEAETAAMTETE